MHFKSIATFLAKNRNWRKCKKKFVRSTKGQHTGISAQCELIIDHITGHPVETFGCGHATFGFGSAPATVWMRWCILANKGFPNLAIVTKFSPLPEQNDDLRFCLLCEKYEWWGRRERAPVIFLKESFADEETCGDRYRTRGMVARPASGHSCRPTSLQWRTWLSAFFFASSFSHSLQQRWPLRSGPARCAHDVTSTLFAPNPAVVVFEI